jgi:hypothetical protein
MGSQGYMKCRFNCLAEKAGAPPVATVAGTAVALLLLVSALPDSNSAADARHVVLLVGVLCDM